MYTVIVNHAANRTRNSAPPTYSSNVVSIFLVGFQTGIGSSTPIGVASDYTNSAVASYKLM